MNGSITRSAAALPSVWPVTQLAPSCDAELPHCFHDAHESSLSPHAANNAIAITKPRRFMALG
jgi:hypothetical protein